LRELQQKANAAIAKARERIHRDLTKVNVLAEQNTISPQVERTRDNP
jgi:hypothetical protein